MAFFSLSHIFILVALVTVIITRRELHSVSILLGLCVCEVICRVLKKASKHPRPTVDFTFGREEFGMPSSHAAFATWVATYVILHCLFRCSGYNTVIRYSIALSVFIFSAVVPYSRVYLHYHYTEQVVAGMGLGVVLSMAWFTFTVKILQPHVFPWLEQVHVVEMLYFKDSSSTQNVLAVEWQESRLRRGMELRVTALKRAKCSTKSKDS